MFNRLSVPRRIRTSAGWFFVAAATLLWVAAGLCPADIFRWDNGQLIPGTEGITPGPGINLSGWNRETQNLGYADLREVNLSFGQFRSSWMYNANLTRANLTGANLLDAYLHGSTLTGANLTEADLTGANLSQATLTDANLTGAVVSSAFLLTATSRGFTKEQLYSTASYRDRKLSRIGLYFNNLNGWDFGNQDLSYARFDSAELKGTNLAGALVTGADFSDTTSRGFTKEQLYSTASYQEQKLIGIDLSDNNLNGWDFSNQDLTRASLNSSTLKSANLAGAMLMRASLGSATLTDANLAGANLMFVDFHQSDLTRANLTGAHIVGVDFHQSNLTGANLAGQNLMFVNLSDSTLTSADLSGADLTGAQIGSATLSGANLTGALVTKAYFRDTTLRGFTKEQLYSTRSYQQRNLQGIGLVFEHLTGWDFSNQDLTNARLDTSVIVGAYLTRANLTNANLSSSTVTGADLTGANLTNANLSSSALAGAYMTGAIVTGASFSNTTSRGFTKEQLYSTASYQQKNLTGIGLGENDLTRWDLSHQNLSGASLYGSTLTNANLAEAIVTGASFYHTTSRGFTKEQLYSTASYQQHNLQGITLSDNDLIGWDFSGQNLADANLYFSTLTNANLTETNLTNAALAYSTLTDANLTGANLANALVFRSTLTGANLTGAVVTGADLSGATSRSFTKEQLYSTASYQQKNLQGIRLGLNDLSGWDFTGQNLAGALLYESMLTNANLTGAVVTEANFYDTTSRGFTKEQLYSTASYQQKNLQGVGLSSNNLKGWDFSGQNLTRASFNQSNLTNAILTLADTRGAVGLATTYANTRNMIWPDGSIQGLDLAAGERLVVRDYAGSFVFGPPANVVTIVGGMSISPTGQLDLGHNSLIVNNGNLADVTAQIARGFHGGAWDGFGIASSAAASDPNQLTALGVMLNDDGQGGDIYSIFAGLSVGPRDVLVKWTFYGDTDLNGVVDGDDLVSFNVGYLNNLSGWVNGDFDYSGVVDGDDLTVLLVSYNQTHGGPYTGQVLSDGGVRAVPEPGTLALAALGALGLALAARRRSK